MNRNRPRDWAKERWKVTHVRSETPLLAEPHLLAARSTPADPKQVFHQRVIGDFVSVFTVGPVWVVVELADFGGRLEPIRIEVRGYSSVNDQTAYPITAGTLRKIRPSELIKGAIAERVDVMSTLMARARKRPPSRERLEKLEEARRQIAEAARSNSAEGSSTLSATSGPPRREHLERFSEVIATWIRHKAGGQPNVDAGLELDMSRWTVAKYVGRARRLGIPLGDDEETA